MTLAEAQALLPGSRLVGDGATVLSRVHSDTRTLQSGDLFVALRGERAQLLRRGAARHQLVRHRDEQRIGQQQPRLDQLHALVPRAFAAADRPNTVHDRQVDRPSAHQVGHDARHAVLLVAV